MDFWKSRFDTRQDYINCLENKLQTGSHGDFGCLEDDEVAKEKIFHEPLHFVTDWFEISTLPWKELFKISGPELVHLRQILLNIFFILLID